MERTQIQLTAGQAREVKKAAAAKGLSVAGFIREAVAARLAVDRAASDRERAVGSIGGFRSDRSDVSRRHDEYLDGAFGE